jgi:hypothetical protein
MLCRKKISLHFVLIWKNRFLIQRLFFGLKIKAYVFCDYNLNKLFLIFCYTKILCLLLNLTIYSTIQSKCWALGGKTYNKNL